MANSNLMLHAGGHEVTREQLALFPCPERTKTWAPVSHARVLDTALMTIREAGYTIAKARYGVSGDNARFFGTLDLATQGLRIKLCQDYCVGVSSVNGECV